MTALVPEAILELILRYFGEAALPDFSRTLRIFERAPYRQLRERLAAGWSITDLTDLNHDLGWRWWVASEDHGPVDLRVSFVGPYYLMLDGLGLPTEDAVLEGALEAAGLYCIDRETLERQVTVWEPEASGSVYEYLFEFDAGMPWDR